MVVISTGNYHSSSRPLLLHPRALILQPIIPVSIDFYSQGPPFNSGSFYSVSRTLHLFPQAVSTPWELSFHFQTFLLLPVAVIPNPGGGVSFQVQHSSVTPRGHHSNWQSCNPRSFLYLFYVYQIPEGRKCYYSFHI